MSQKVLICDDFTGEPGAKPYSFNVDGQWYQIDLISPDQLKEALAPFVKAARPVRRPSDERKISKTGGAKYDADAAVRNAEIRAWAKARGLKVPPRGRIPDAIRSACDAGVISDEVRAGYAM